MSGFVYYEEHAWIGGAWRLHRCGEVTRRILWEIACDSHHYGTIVLVNG